MPRDADDPAGSGRGSRGRPTGKRWVYVVLMACCLVLFVCAWAFVRLWSVPAAIGMCVVAMILPPTAAIIANRGEPGASWPEDEEDDGRSDER
ncbi:DUF3099 domain-containing protein [Streptomyces xiaopingdaonensis]|uniref:DUF3099 domain-containing protein n=1 Tax=Streptomyces xiaopingdaonensis TaxID=1565415 RepID=UPI00037EF0C6|nr:DUF3099 domain-containing protein [Streptomyces xiaopingdaonensis]